MSRRRGSFGEFVIKTATFTRRNIRSNIASVASWKKPSRNLPAVNARSTRIWNWSLLPKRIIFLSFRLSKNRFLIFMEHTRISLFRTLAIKKSSLLLVGDYKRLDFFIARVRNNEIKSFVGRGLQDFSISRLKSKMPGGIQVPGEIL